PSTQQKFDLFNKAPMLFRFSLLLVISHIPLSFLMVTNCPIKDLLLSIATWDSFRQHSTNDHLRYNIDTH
ncbi:hypothetical protein ACXIZM_005759, partial [Klebsiella pneumoniae]